MSENLNLRAVNVLRYIQPLREGGSLPALAEADDGFKYVIKFKGSGHGSKMLISEMLGSEIARALGLRVPELVFADLDIAFGQTEADEEIQDLLKFSQGLNLGVHFLSGAITYDPVVEKIEPESASEIVWLDALITNIDRTVKNTNMLWWNKELWLIDQGASFFFHHTWTNWEKHAVSPFIHIKDHVLLPFASELDAVDKEFKLILTDEIIDNIVDELPNEWLESIHETENADEAKSVYKQFLKIRLENSKIFVDEAKKARYAHI